MSEGYYMFEEAICFTLPVLTYTPFLAVSNVVCWSYQWSTVVRHSVLSDTWLKRSSARGMEGERQT